MAEYIMAILRTQLMVVFSWGFHKPQRLPNDAGLAFMADGFKYRGRVEVVYNDGADLFEVHLSDGRAETDVYADCLVQVIDGLVERTNNYKQSVEEFYHLNS
jgi:hypothetical protein